MEILAICVFIKSLPIDHDCPCVTISEITMCQLTLASPKYNFQQTNVPELGDKIKIMCPSSPFGPKILVMQGFVTNNYQFPCFFEEEFKRASNFIEFQSFLFQSFTHHNWRFKVNKRVIYVWNV